MIASAGSEWGPFDDLERRRSKVVQQAENSGRHAVVMGTFNTTGWGEVAFEDRVNFGLRFIEVPTITYSMYIDGDTLVDTRFPRCQGGVYKWQKDKRGLYIGAFCFVTVETKSPFVTTTEPEPGYSIVHHFTFQGQAIKVIADDQAELIE